ncbi:universal stress protein [Haladaptatus pallidirubidus]|uniref:UspA domain-containing protein n=1 Tax=Haladaptatus pallidirubidus TaxID=1008152 RepID=A0AAV3UJT3_9EURY|nr:universal stress protein [Haladaptatus pallidirubidus]
MPIIVAVDGDRSEEILVTEGEKLAKAFDLELQVVHVMNRDSFRDLEEQSVEDTGKTISLDDIRSMAREIASAAISDAGVDATAVGLVGDPANEVVKYAKNHATPYLVIGGKKRSAVGKALFGSTTQSILLNSDIPVVTVMGK